MPTGCQRQHDPWGDWRLTLGSQEDCFTVKYFLLLWCVNCATTYTKFTLEKV
jgi:hypothetical protein